MTGEFTDEFARALRQVMHDIDLDEGGGADLTAVGINRNDCLRLLQVTLEETPDAAVAAAVAVQLGVAVGVWIERRRWDGTP